MQPRGGDTLIISFRPQHLIGWVITFIACLVPLYYWFGLHPLSQFNNYAAIMIELGRATGLVGMVLYALNFVYATRLRVFESWFGGLNRVYIAHHIIGGFALIFLALHPLLLSVRLINVSMFQSAMLLMPNRLTPLSALFQTTNPYHAQVLQQWAIFFGIISFWGMVALLLVTFFITIPYRIWLFTHKFLSAFLFFAGLHVLFVTSDTSVSMPLRWYILGLTAIGLVAALYRLFSGKILVRHYKYSVAGTLMKGGAYQILLTPTEQSMPYKPGQFVFVRFVGAEGFGITDEWHPFSISSSPREHYLELTIKGLGDYTKKLGNLPIGARAEVEGAYGKFSNHEYKNPNQIWIAGGIGITPFLSMAKTLPEQNIDVTLYYSVRTASEIIDWKKLYDIAAIRPGQFHVFPFISEQQNGAFLSADYIEQTSGPAQHKEVYICGPPPMMKSLKAQFKAKKLPGTSIHTEEFAMS